MYAIINTENVIVDLHLVEANDEGAGDIEAQEWARGLGYDARVDGHRLVVMTTHVVHVGDEVEVDDDGRASPVRWRILPGSGGEEIPMDAKYEYAVWAGGGLIARVYSTEAEAKAAAEGWTGRSAWGPCVMRRLVGDGEYDVSVSASERPGWDYADAEARAWNQA